MNILEEKCEEGYLCQCKDVSITKSDISLTIRCSNHDYVYYCGTINYIIIFRKDITYSIFIDQIKIDKINPYKVLNILKRKISISSLEEANEIVDKLSILI